MNIQEKIKTIPEKLFGVLKGFPVELGLFWYLFVILVLYREKVFTDVSFLVLVPLFITIAYVLNNLLPSKLRLLYYASWLPLAFLSFWSGWSSWLKTEQCIITIGILLPLAILLCRKQKENRRFIGDIIRYVYSGGVAVFMSGITLALSMGIFFSIVYIFKVLEGNEIQETVIEYSVMIAFLLLFPLIFFTFLSRSFNGELRGARLTDTMLNYIITPALLVYTIILYLYFIQIIVLWELPQGGIAYLVFGFIMLAMTVQALQMFVIQSLYNWYFNYFSILSIPALIMFWIGTAQRVLEYGFTEWRVYLIVCGVIMTVGVGMFLLKRYRSYLYLFVFAFVVFTGIAYFSGFSAKSISLRSQECRARTLATTLQLLDPQGAFLIKSYPAADSSYSSEYRKLYSSLLYLEDKAPERLASFGLTSTINFLDIVPEEIRKYVLYGKHDDDSRAQTLWIQADSYAWEMNLKEYDKLYVAGVYDTSSVYTRYENQTLTIRNGDSILFSMPGRDLVNTQLKPFGYSLDRLPSRTELEAISDKLLVYTTDSLLLKIEQISISVEDGNATIMDITPRLLLKK